MELKKQTLALTWNLGGRRAAVMGGGTRPGGNGIGESKTVARTFSISNVQRHFNAILSDLSPKMGENPNAFTQVKMSSCVREV